MQHPGMEHPYTRYVALGDSFTEGVGDEEPDLPNGVRGWADRVAEELARTNPGFEYANLAIRGRLLGQIVDEQLEPAIALQPDLVTISAGGNDLIRRAATPMRSRRGSTTSSGGCARRVPRSCCSTARTSR